MKVFLLTLSIFALAIACLHAQTPDVLISDPALQSLTSLLPPAYAAYGSLALLAWMVLGRAFTALKNNGGLKGIYNAIVNGVTMKLLLTGFALLTLAACDTPKTAAEAAKRQRYEAIGDKLLTIGTRLGYVTPEEAADIRDIGALALPSVPPSVDVTSGK